jgi:hypothetical protein
VKLEAKRAYPSREHIVPIPDSLSAGRFANSRFKISWNSGKLEGVSARKLPSAEVSQWVRRPLFWIEDKVFSGQGAINVSIIVIKTCHCASVRGPELGPSGRPIEVWSVIVRTRIALPLELKEFKSLAPLSPRIG